MSINKKKWKKNITKNESIPFCFSKSECKTEGINEKDLCFDFSDKNNETVLFYVREDEYIKEQLELKKEIAKDKLEFTSSSLSSLMREFHKIEETDNKYLKKTVNISI